MPTMKEVNRLQKVNRFIDEYDKKFKQIFQHQPDISEQDRSAITRIVDRTNIREQEIEHIVEAYFLLEDEWVRSQGFPLSLIEKKFNAILTSLSRDLSSTPRIHWVVALTETGKPVVDYDKNVLKGGTWFKPVPWNTWITQSAEEKAQLRRGVHVDKNFLIWRENWSKWQKEWRAYDGE